jgi:hypothetical protein
MHDVNYQLFSLFKMQPIALNRLKRGSKSFPSGLRKDREIRETSPKVRGFFIFTYKIPYKILIFKL